MGVFAFFMVTALAMMPMLSSTEARLGPRAAGCMFFALDYAEELVANERIEALRDEQVRIVATFEELMDDGTRPPEQRLDEARSMLRSREMRDLDREISPRHAHP